MTPNSDKTAPQRLRARLAQPGLIMSPCCFDGLSARLIEQEGFELSFMSGFAVSAARLGLPDAGLISYGEMLDQARNITQAVSIPVLGDGDTGHGNAMNVRRTVAGFRAAGLAGVMIEDQVAPKRCGHARGKAVVDRKEAEMRVRAACDERDENGDVLIIARTDARHDHGLDEAIARAKTFKDLGADILFIEAPRDEDEMRRICQEVPGYHMANMLEGGDTPILPPEQLEEIGFKIASYPLTLLSSAMRTMITALRHFKGGKHPTTLMGWPELKRRIGFEEYDKASERYQMD